MSLMSNGILMDELKARLDNIAKSAASIRVNLLGLPETPLVGPTPTEQQANDLSMGLVLSQEVHLERMHTTISHVLDDLAAIENGILSQNISLKGSPDTTVQKVVR